MSTKVKSWLSPKDSKLFILVPILTIVVVFILVLYFFSSAKQSCEDIASVAKKMVAEKKYQNSYDYLKAKANVCKNDSNGLVHIRYQQYLAISADKTGDNKTAHKVAKTALDDYKKLKDSDKKKMGDGLAFSESMFDIIDSAESKGIVP